MLIFFHQKIGAVKRLSENGLLDPEAIIKIDEAAIRDLIHPVLTHKNAEFVWFINGIVWQKTSRQSVEPQYALINLEYPRSCN
jgi:hypothetical protein